MRRSNSIALSVWGMVGILAILNAAPLAWGILASIKTEVQILQGGPLTPTFENYQRVIDSGFLAGVRNSALYAIVTVASGLAVGALAAFGFDRFQFPCRSSLLLVVIASIPLAVGSGVLLIPNYLFFSGIGLTNSFVTLPLLYCAYTLPMTIWIIKNNVEAIPKELDEAAYIDGASSLTIFFRIVLPLSKPALGAVGLLIFLYSWNEFVAGSVMVDANHLKPIQPLLYAFVGFFGREWGALTAAACIAVAPVLVVYCFFGRLLVSGLTSGAVRG